MHNSLFRTRNEPCTHRNNPSTTNDFIPAGDEGMRGLSSLHIAIALYHVVHAPHVHMVQACTGTAGRVIRELEAIAASDVYHREALLKHAESCIEPVVRRVLCGGSQYTSGENDRCVCERVSRVGAAVHDNDHDMQRNRDAGLADHRVSIAPSYIIPPASTSDVTAIRRFTDDRPSDGALSEGHTLHFGKVTCTHLYDQTVNPRDLIGMFHGVF
jgi:hypothetical protein